MPRSFRRGAWRSLRHVRGRIGARMLDEPGERKGMALVPRGDEHYPPLLRHIAHPPHLLYVYGADGFDGSISRRGGAARGAPALTD